jgi:hypothetical protein
VGQRYNQPPGWPPAPAGFTPPPGWRPDPSWPPPPAGWPVWLDDDPPTQTWVGPAVPAAPAPVPPYPGPGRGRPGAGGTSRWAVAALVLGLLAVIPAAVVTAVIALHRTRRRRQRGAGLALASLALSAGWAVLFAAVLTVNSHVATRQSAGGPITKPGDLGVFALTTGDCFDNPAQSANITSVTALPCTQPHDAQVYAAFRLSGADDQFPGQAAVDKLAGTGCNARAGRLDQARVTAAMTTRYLDPVPDGWAQGDRTIDCLIVSPAPTLTSSVLRM